MTPPTCLIDLRLAGYRTGGISRYASELFKAIRCLDSIRARAIRSKHEETEDPDALRIWTPPHHRFERTTIPVELRLSRTRPDIYHATDFIVPRFASRIRTVATVHDLAFLQWPEYLQPDALRYYRQLHRSRKSTAAWITPSQWSADLLAELVDIDPARITVVPHGVSLGLGGQRPLQYEERGDFLLAVGTIEPRKRYGLLLDALEGMNPSPTLVVAGNAGWKSDDTAHRLCSQPFVHHLESVSDDQLRDLYRRALALIVPSRDEGFGLHALEAMASGTPVVSSGRGALPEVTGCAAQEPCDDTPSSWRATIERIQTDRHLWERLSREGFDRARTYSWDRAARATAEVYRAVLDR